MQPDLTAGRAGDGLLVSAGSGEAYTATYSSRRSAILVRSISFSRPPTALLAAGLALKEKLEANAERLADHHQASSGECRRQ